MPDVAVPESSGNGRGYRVPRPDDLRNLKLGRRPQTSAPDPSPGPTATDEDSGRGLTTPTRGDWVEPGQQPPRSSGPEWIDPRDRREDSSGDSGQSPWQRMFGAIGSHSDAMQLGKPPSHLRRLAAHMVDCVIITAALSVIFPLVLGQPYLDIDPLRAWINELIDQANLAQGTGAEAIQTPNAGPESIPIRSPGINIATGLTLAAYILYHGVLLGQVGTTIGKRFMGISVFGPDGLPIGIPRGVIRSVGLYLTTTFAAVGFLVVLIHPRRRALHDLIAGSHPIERAESFERVDQV